MRPLLLLLAWTTIAAAEPAPHTLEDKPVGLLLGRYGIQLPLGMRTPARWLGRPASWLTWQRNAEHQAEIEVKLGDVRVRAWCTARGAGGLREAQRIVGEVTVQ